MRELAAEAAGVSVDSWNFVPPQRARMIRELAPLTVALETVLTGLERSFMQQRRFVGDAAHELKTAVAVLKSSLQLLTLKQRTAVEYERGIERCQLDCERLEETVAKMLTLARLETNGASTGVATDLAHILRQAAQQFESMAELKRLQILVMAEGPVMVDIDPEQLQLLCANLLLNALQHSPAGSAIRAVQCGRMGSAQSSRLRMTAMALRPRIYPTSSTVSTAGIPREAAIQEEPAWDWPSAKRSRPGGRERSISRAS